MTTDLILIRELASRDREAWIDLRASLWPDEPDARAEADRFFEDGTIGGLPHAVFVAEARTGAVSGALVGFAECSLRLTSETEAGERQAHLEGWFVRPDWRRRGIGRRLVTAVVEWAQHQQCCKLTSDTTDIYAALSVPAHQGCGFQVEQVESAATPTALESRAESVRFWRAVGPTARPDRP